MVTEVPDYAAVLADLKARRAQLDTAIEAIEAIMALTGGAAVVGAGVTAPAAIRADLFFGMGALEAAIAYLRIVKKPQSPNEIAEALERGGLTHSSQNLANTLYTTLSRSASHNGPVVKVGKNWGLAEWYPGLKNKRPGPRGAATEAAQDDEDDQTEATAEDDSPIASEQPHERSQTGAPA